MAGYSAVAPFSVIRLATILYVHSSLRKGAFNRKYDPVHFCTCSKVAMVGLSSDKRPKRNAVKIDIILGQD